MHFPTSSFFLGKTLSHVLTLNAGCIFGLSVETWHQRRHFIFKIVLKPFGPLRFFPIFFLGAQSFVLFYLPRRIQLSPLCWNSCIFQSLTDGHLWLLVMLSSQLCMCRVVLLLLLFIFIISKFQGIHAQGNWKKTRSAVLPTTCSLRLEGPIGPTSLVSWGFNYYYFG